MHVFTLVVLRVAARLAPSRDDERGASMVEYALLVALIFLVCVTALTVLGETTSEKFSEMDSMLG